MKTDFQKRIAKLDAATRIERAKKLLADKIINDVRVAIDIQANNEYLLYSNQLVDQIPRSYAANAYNILIGSVFHYAALRTVVLWDSARKDRASIQTVVEYIDDPAVIDALADEHLKAFKSRDEPRLYGIYDPEIDAEIDRLNKQLPNSFAEKQARKARRALHWAVYVARRIAVSGELRRVREWRDIYPVLFTRRLENVGGCSLSD